MVHPPDTENRSTKAEKCDREIPHFVRNDDQIQSQIQKQVPRLAESREILRRSWSDRPVEVFGTQRTRIEDDGVVQSADQEIGVPGGSAQSQEWLATIRFHS